MRGHPQVFRLFLAAILSLACSACQPGAGDSAGKPGGGSPLPRLRIYHQELPPAECAEEDSRIKTLRAKRDFEAMAGAYPSLLNCLSGSWGGKADGRLCPYHYNLCLARNNSQGPLRALAEINAGIKAWPESFQHRVLFASTLMRIGVSRSTIPEGTDEAVDIVLDPLFHPLLKEMRISPESLHVQWAHLLLRLKRTGEGFAQIQRALELQPDHFRARHLKANFLVALQRGREAVALTRELLKERPEDGSLEMILLSGCLDTGETVEALELYERLRSRAGTVFSSRLKVKIAGGFNSLKRYAEARELLLEVLIEDPEDSGGLHQLATALRGLKIPAASQALIRRSKELHAYFYERLEADSAARGNRLAQYAFNRARALNELDRTGELLQVLDKALEVKKELIDLQLIKADVLLRLGRTETQRVELERLVLAEQCPAMIRLVLARLRLRAGDREGAAKLIEEPREDLSRLLKDSPRLGAHLLRIARESGDLDEVSRLVDFLDTADLGSNGNPEVAMLCKAEVHLREGRLKEARSILNSNYRMLEGGDTWAGALRLLAGSGNSRGEDLSDLVDHPEVARSAAAFSHVVSTPAIADLLERADRLRRESGKLLARMRGFSDGDVLPLWRELLRLYRESGASRKARETAWYLWHLDPGGLEATRSLVSTLQREEEVLTRLYVLENGLKRHPADVGLKTLRERTVLFLGIGKQ